MSDAEKKNHGDLADNYVAIDIEYAGAEPGQDGIIMLSAVKVVGGRSIGKFKSLIAPQPESVDKASKKTGIDGATLEKAPKLETMLPVFLSFIGSDTVVGHDIGFVGKFLDGLYRDLLGDDAGADRIDTKTLAMELYPELESYDLDKLSEHLFPNSTAQRHDSKAELTARCYEYMKRYSRRSGAGQGEKKQAPQSAPVTDAKAETGAVQRPKPETVPPEPAPAEKPVAEAPKQEPKARKQVDLESAFTEGIPLEPTEEQSVRSGKVMQILLKIALAVLAVAICVWLVMYVFKQKTFWLIGALIMIPFYLGVIIALGKKRTK